MISPNQEDNEELMIDESLKDSPPASPEEEAAPPTPTSSKRKRKAKVAPIRKETPAKDMDYETFKKVAKILPSPQPTTRYINTLGEAEALSGCLAPTDIVFCALTQNAPIGHGNYIGPILLDKGKGLGIFCGWIDVGNLTGRFKSAIYSMTIFDVYTEVDRFKYRLTGSNGTLMSPKMAQSQRLRIDLAEVESVRAAYPFLAKAADEIEKGSLKQDEAVYSICKTSSSFDAFDAFPSLICS